MPKSFCDTLRMLQQGQLVEHISATLRAEGVPFRLGVPD